MADAFDVVVIGAGRAATSPRSGQPAGLVTAIVEREALGGICLNWGCIPPSAAEVGESTTSWATWATMASRPRTGLRLRQGDRQVAAVAKQLSGGVAFLMKKHKIAVLDGPRGWRRRGGAGVWWR